MTLQVTDREMRVELNYSVEKALKAGSLKHLHDTNIKPRSKYNKKTITTTSQININFCHFRPV